MKLEKLSDIKTDPDMRIVFQKEHHQDFLDLLAVAEKYNVNPTTLSRHVLLVWLRPMIKSTIQAEKDRQILDVIQSIHGVNQLDLFQTPPNVEQSAQIKKSKTNDADRLRRLNRKRNAARKEARQKKRVRPGKVVKK